MRVICLVLFLVCYVDGMTVCNVCREAVKDNDFKILLTRIDKEGYEERYSADMCTKCVYEVFTSTGG